jgi:mannose-1-phosphate guanylyltransferase
MWSFERQLFPSLVERGEPVFGFASDSYWLDIGTPERYLRAHWDILEGRTASEPLGELVHDGLLLGDGAKWDGLTGPAVLGPGASASADAKLERAVLLEGASVEGDAVVVDSVIGPRGVVRAKAECRSKLVGAGEVIE